MTEKKVNDFLNEYGRILMQNHNWDYIAVTEYKNEDFYLKIGGYNLQKELDFIENEIIENDNTNFNRSFEKNYEITKKGDSGSCIINNNQIVGMIIQGKGNQNSFFTSLNTLKKPIKSVLIDGGYKTMQFKSFNKN